ncbi:uncharacterized protein LOC117758703 [Hippoglossus hippoglossus]|uniref:uncharacterized protein LOC117758703 n=1 Tax=Hippoglossus hippoglossus TaxID=8267 RepID=UPI00148E7D6F|nr:uncharacterized protein LOC117758703 [Hippoglossus hippoglossus]
MRTAALILGLVFTCAGVTDGTAGGHLEGLVETGVQSECRDRYLWIQVASVQTPRFEAVDENGVHSISELLASRCGYTISTFKMDGFTTFRASYYSCFTHIQNDEVFTFRFNVIMSDGGGRWNSRPVSATCSGLTWTHREVICEEDYMEVNVNRESSCGGQRGESGHVWQAAFSQAQMTASSVWQLMFLQSDGQVSSMSISEAQTQGYSLTTTSHRVVLRSQYKQRQASVVMVEGVPIEVLRVSVFLKKKLMVVMMDVSMSCTVNSGSFDSASLLWDVPWIMMPLVEEDARFESQTVSVGVEGVLLDQPTATARGFSLVRRGGLVQIRVRFGAEGGYRKSVVLNNVYKELYVIFLLYEHVFSLTFEDNSSIITRHRMLRVLDTPLICRPPFSVDKTRTNDEAFSVYLGNIPADVVLEEVWINGKQLRMSALSIERGVSISPVSHVNGSRAYKLRLPFEDADVLWMYLGAGVVQYSVDINFTLTIVHRRDSYYHHTFISARLFSLFPPQITAQCFDGGITFSVVRPPRAKSLWEVGVDHEPLTSQLAAQRGYRLLNDTHKTSLDVPVFSIGYTYEDINLSFFYGTFKLLLRDSKSLAVQTSTSKRCLFKTRDMTVCSADGTVTVVTTPTSTWPMVRPERTSLLDATCRSKQTDGSRVLFEFNVNSCGTRAMVGESYVVYENEIIHDKQLIADGPNVISRESQFKLTVRCFYPLSGVNRLSVSRVFRSPGFGSIEVFQSIKDSANKVPARDCLQQVPGNDVNTPMNQAHLEPGIRPLPKPGPSRFITVPRQHNKVVSSSDIQTSPTLNLSPETQTAQNQVLDQNPKRTMSMERRNIEMLQSRVKNIRVKPMIKLVSSGNHLKWKPSIKQVNSQMSNPGLMDVSANRNHRTSKPLHDRRCSITRRKTDFQTEKQEQGAHGVQGKLHQSEVIRLPDQSPTQMGPQQNLVQSGVETENHMREEPASALRTVVQSAGTTHIRVRPGHSGRLQTPDQPRLQNPDSLTRGGISRTSDLSFTLQNTVVIRECEPTNPNAQSNEGLNPTTGGTGLPGPGTSPTGSDPGSVLKIHSRSDSGSQYGSSVHRGIMRGEPIS